MGSIWNASSTEQQRIGQGELALSGSLTGYGQSAMSGGRMGYGTVRDVISIVRLTFDSAFWLTRAILSLSVGALSVSSVGLDSVHTVT